jgi:hypothetical protein
VLLGIGLLADQVIDLGQHVADVEGFESRLPPLLAEVTVVVDLIRLGDVDVIG